MGDVAHSQELGLEGLRYTRRQGSVALGSRITLHRVAQLIAFSGRKGRRRTSGAGADFDSASSMRGDPRVPPKMFAAGAKKGAKNDIILKKTSKKQCAGGKKAAEQGLILGGIPKESGAGAEARLVQLALSARLKSCPDTKPWKSYVRTSFSAAC